MFTQEVRCEKCGVRKNARNMETALHIFGLVMMLFGVALAHWGYELSGSLTSQLTKTVSGILPDEVMYRYLGGAFCWVFGIFLLFRK